MISRRRFLSFVSSFWSILLLQNFFAVVVDAEDGVGKALNGATLTLLNQHHGIGLGSHNRGGIEDLSDHDDSLGGDIAAFPYILYSTATGDLWSTDGTGVFPLVVNSPVTTVQRNDDGPYGIDNDVVYFNGFFYFGYKGGLWVSDGKSPESTRQIKSLSGDDSDVAYSIREVLVFQDELFFASENNLWKTDGTEAGTVIVQSFPFGYNVRDMGAPTKQFGGGGEDFFLLRVRNSTTSTLYRTVDGTEGTTTVLSPDSPGLRIRPGYKNPVLDNGMMLFSDDNGIWRSDGTLDGTEKFISTYTSRRFASDTIDGKAMFIHEDRSFVFTTEGTSASTGPLNICLESPQREESYFSCETFPTDPVTDFGEVSAFAGSVSFLPNFNGRRMFAANGFGPGVSDGLSVWRTDTTSTGTELVAVLNGFEPWDGDHMPDGKFAMRGNANGKDQIWCLSSDGTTVVLIAEFESTSDDLWDLKTIQSLDENILIVAQGTGIWRLDVPVDLGQQEQEGEPVEEDVVEGQNSAPVEEDVAPGPIVEGQNSAPVEEDAAPGPIVEGQNGAAFNDGIYSFPLLGLVASVGTMYL